MSRFGLIEMTRQRVRESVIHDTHEDCSNCKGSGLIPTIPTLVSQIERWIQRYRATKGDRRIVIRVQEDVHKYMTKGKFSRRLQLMWKYWMKIDFKIFIHQIPTAVKAFEFYVNHVCTPPMSCTSAILHPPSSSSIDRNIHHLQP